MRQSSPDNLFNNRKYNAVLAAGALGAALALSACTSASQERPEPASSIARPAPASPTTKLPLKKHPKEVMSFEESSKLVDRTAKLKARVCREIFTDYAYKNVAPQKINNIEIPGDALIDKNKIPGFYISKPLNNGNSIGALFDSEKADAIVEDDCVAVDFRDFKTNKDRDERQLGFDNNAPVATVTLSDVGAKSDDDYADRPRLQNLENTAVTVTNSIGRPGLQQTPLDGISVFEVVQEAGYETFFAEDGKVVSKALSSAALIAVGK